MARIIDIVVLTRQTGNLAKFTTSYGVKSGIDYVSLLRGVVVQVGTPAHCHCNVKAHLEENLLDPVDWMK